LTEFLFLLYSLKIHIFGIEIVTLIENITNKSIGRVLILNSHSVLLIVSKFLSVKSI